MSLSVSEASAVNVVLQELFDLEGREPSISELREAAIVLARGANRKLMAGVRPEQVASARMRGEAR